jgi:hypothetical protein
MEHLIKEVLYGCAAMTVSEARDVLELFDAAGEPFIFSYAEYDNIIELAAAFPSKRASDVLVDYCGGPPGFEAYYTTTLTVMIADYILTAIVRYDMNQVSTLIHNLAVVGLQFNLDSSLAVPF